MDEKYVDFKEFQIYLGKKARAYKFFYSLNAYGLKGWREMLQHLFEENQKLVTSLTEKGIKSDQYFDIVRIYKQDLASPFEH